MIGCYVTGILPRPKKLIEVTRAYDRKKVDKETLEKAFQEATKEVIEAQVQAELSYITDGMLKWQDLLRPFTENLEGLAVGSLARWFNNNAFYRKPVILDTIRRTKNIVASITYIQFLPKDLPWKAILPAPYTFAKLSENKFYKNEREVMFAYAEAIREEIKNLAEIGFQYIQLSDPALVYNPLKEKIPKDMLVDVKEALRTAMKNAKVRSCLHTFFGDFSEILPEALDFPVNDLGIDMYETNIDKLKEYTFDGKGVALGLLDARGSLIEDEDELLRVVNELTETISSKTCDIFVCPNCDLEFLPWEKAREKIEVMSRVAKTLKARMHAHG
ncbi:MAG: hypothetical protein QXV65_01280 [Candidatus Bathyarchaeia archaeon]